MIRIFSVLLAVIASSSAFSPLSAQKAVFLDLDVHVLLGGSYLTQNYRSCYPEISDINSGMGFSGGLGVGARINLHKRIALGTEVNFTNSAEKMDMAVIGGLGEGGNQSVSNVFQRNSYRKFDFPMFMSYITALSKGVAWNVDGGVYYSYGISGSQKNNIYDTRLNDLGQLMMSVVSYDTGFYNDTKAYINSYKRGEWGIHLATGLTFLNRVRVGLRGHFGLTNIARSTGIVSPSSHTIDLQTTVGWVF